MSEQSQNTNVIVNETVNQAVDFTVNRKELEVLVNSALVTVSSKPSIPVLGMLKLDVAPDAVTVTGSNSDFTVQTHLPATNNNLEVAKAGSILVPAINFGKVIQGMSSNKIHIATNEEENNSEVVISNSSSQVALPTAVATTYPKLFDETDGKTVEMNASSFSDAITATAYSAAEDDTRPALKAIRVKVAKDQVLFDSTDSHRASHTKASTANSVEWIDGEDDYTILLLATLAKKALSLFNQNDDTNPIVLSLTKNGNSVQLSQGANMRLSLRLMEGNYPAIDRIWASTSTTDIVVDRDSLKNALKRLFLISDSMRTRTVTATINGDGLELKAENTGVGKMKQKVALESFEGEELQIAFNPHYLDSALATMPEKVKLHFNGNLRPICMDANEFVTKALITPIKTYN